MTTPDPQAGEPPRPAPSPGEAAWTRVSRYDRRAEVVAVDWLTGTGTVKVTAEVVDSRPFEYLPGHFVAIEEDVPGAGLRHSPYCIFTPPSAGRTFQMLVRVFPEGLLAQYLSSLSPGDPIHFRGPSGRSMVPKSPDTTLVLLATGVGISPFNSLVRHLLEQGDERPIVLYWGLRLTDDICLVDELGRLAAEHPSFSYRISLSQPPPDWRGLRGRVTESVPPLLETLGGQAFYLSGNGAMCEEMETALSDFGVDRTLIHQERFFNVRHKPDAATLDAIRSRFVANDLFSPYVEAKAPLLFAIERDIKGRAVGPG
jgi:ferredoxin-NADP reductase